MKQQPACRGPSPNVCSLSRRLRLTVLMVLAAAHLPQAQDILPRAHLETISLSSFSDDEIDVPSLFGHTIHPLPYYVAHLHTLANSVNSSGPETGFIDLRVWRSRGEFRRRNPRVMENVLTLAFFYVTERHWNPYYGSPAMRERLELALRFWLSRQSPDGNMKPSGDNERPTMVLGTTMFFTKFLGQTLVLLDGGPPITAELLEQAVRAQRQALVFLLTSDAAFEQGRRYSNQFGNVWAGAYAYLHLHEDPELRRLLHACIAKSQGEFQSAAGYPYENHSTDFQYSLGTHHSNVEMAWHFIKQANRAEGQWLTADARLWAEWLSYNAVPEPDWHFFFLNRAIECRQSHAGFERVEVAFAENVPELWAFAVTDAEAGERQQTIRRNLRENWPTVTELRVPQYRSITPYAFLHRNHLDWRPDTEQRNRARDRLPCFRPEPFVHQRVDTRRPFAATFIKRPGYYAIFNGGEQRNAVQTFGLGLIWHPDGGTLLQSQTRLLSAAWGVRTPETERVIEQTQPVKATYVIENTVVLPTGGNRDLPGGTLHISYPILENGTKTVRFADDHVVVTIDNETPFVEQIPLLAGDAGDLSVEQNRIRLTQDGSTVVIDADGALSCTIVDTDRRVHRKTVQAVHVRGQGRLIYTLRVPAPRRTGTP